MEATIGQALSWTKALFDYTDEVVNALTDSVLDWRPSDGRDGWFFSIGEQAKHIVDSRHQILAWLDGSDAAERVFQIGYGGTEKPWEFKPATAEQIKQSLAAGRAKVDKLLETPLEEALGSTPYLIKLHEEALAKLRAEGKDTSERETKGPGRIINSILFLTAHEQSHRSVLQHHLRLAGVDVPRLA